jgi:hypothetical protein
MPPTSPKVHTQRPPVTHAITRTIGATIDHRGRTVPQSTGRGGEGRRCPLVSPRGQPQHCPGPVPRRAAGDSTGGKPRAHATRPRWMMTPGARTSPTRPWLAAPDGCGSQDRRPFFIIQHQLPSGSTTYRLVGHVARASASPEGRGYALVHDHHAHAVPRVVQVVAVQHPDAQVVRAERHVVGLAGQHI